MKLKFMLPLAFLLVAACDDTDMQEVYNSSNTFVKSGVVYDIEERPINGVYKIYYSNGKVKMEVESKNGKPHGVGKFYNENGNLVFKGKFRNGLMHGEMLNYYTNGEVHNEMNYKMGVKHGDFITFDNSGKKVLEVNFEKGKAVSGKSFKDVEKVLSTEELKKLSTK